MVYVWFCFQALPEHGVYTVFVELGDTKIEVRAMIFCLFSRKYFIFASCGLDLLDQQIS